MPRAVRLTAAQQRLRCRPASRRTAVLRSTTLRGTGNKINGMRMLWRPACCQRRQPRRGVHCGSRRQSGTGVQPAPLRPPMEAVPRSPKGHATLRSVRSANGQHTRVPFSTSSCRLDGRRTRLQVFLWTSTKRRCVIPSCTLTGDAWTLDRPPRLAHDFANNRMSWEHARAQWHIKFCGSELPTEPDARIAAWERALKQYRDRSRKELP